MLYIEDNVANLTLIRRICERRPSVELLTAMQGGVGLDLVRQQRPDLILLDLHLPDLSGADVLRELKNDPRLSEIPVIIVSADAIPSQVQRLLAAGARNYVTKPIHVEEILGLFDEVGEALSRANQPAADGERILVVEDDAALRKLIARILNGQGYEVATAGDSGEAIAAAESARIDLLLTDVTLPGVRGPELARKIQAIHPGVAILYVTGHSEEELTAGDSPATEALLQKPFTADSLVSLTRTLIDAGRRASAAS